MVMWVSKICFIVLIFFSYIHVSLSQAAHEARFSKELPEKRRGNKETRSKHVHQLNEVDYHISCKEDHPLCLLQIQNTRLQTKSKKIDRRCCKMRQRRCKRRTVRRCKSKTKCLVRHFRKCRKQFSRCGSRKAVNRRPGNCESEDQRRNLHHPKIPKITTTVMPKKKLKEKCHHPDECEAGLCCARHQHVKICQPLIKEGQVCKKDFRNLNKRSPEMYERCPCETGLTCAPSMERHNTCQVIT